MDETLPTFDTYANPCTILFSITIFDNNSSCAPYDPTNNRSGYRLQEDNPCDGWPKVVRKVFVAAIVVAAIFLAEKTFVKLIAIDYHRKQYEQKIKTSKRMIRLLDLLYEESRNQYQHACPEFEEEDEAIQGSNMEELRRTITKGLGVRTKVLNDVGLVSTWRTKLPLKRIES